MEGNITSSSYSSNVLAILTYIQYYIIAIMNPTLAILGTIGNVIIIFFLPKKKIKMNDSSKFYCVTIAIGDLGALLFYHVREFVSVGLWFITSGRYYFHYFNQISCKFYSIVYFIFFTISLYTVIAFSIERNIALYWPLKYRAYVAKNVAIVLLCICCSPPLLFLVPLGSLSINSIQLSSSQLPYCVSDPNSPLYAIFSTALTFFMMLFHPPITAILVLGIILKIITSTYHRAKLGVRVKEEALSITEKRSVVTLLAVALINLVIFLPSTIFYSGTFIIRVQSPSSSIRPLWELLARLAFQLTSLTHSANFFVYFTIIPTFRSALLHKNLITSQEYTAN